MQAHSDTAVPRGNPRDGWPDRRVTLKTCILLAIGFLVVRIPFASKTPVNWDSVQFVIGTENFNLHHHQPHPPGYIGYVFLGRLLNTVTGDPHLSLIIISLVSGALVPVGFYLLARRFMPHIYALLGSIAFGSSIVVWYYSTVALTYVVELAAGLFLLWALRRATEDLDPRFIYAAAALLALLGSFRQSAVVFFLPIIIWAAFKFPWRTRIRASALLGVLTALWAVPLLWLAGGPRNYYRESKELADLVSPDSSIPIIDPGSLAQNITFVVAGIILGVNVGLIIVARYRSNWGAWLPFSDRVFFAFWSLPALATFIFGHTGQLGYVLILLPIPFIWAGMELSYAHETNDARYQVMRSRLVRWTQVSQAPALIICMLFILINSLGFVLIPRGVNAIAIGNVPFDIRQYNINASDQHWRDIVHLVQDYDPQHTAVLTTIGGPRVSGSFRHLSYLTPEYTVYGLGHDIEYGTFGPLFIAQNGISTYSIDQMANASPVLPLNPAVRYLVIPDADIIDRIHPSSMNNTHVLPDGTEVLIVFVEENTVLRFSMGGELITEVDCTFGYPDCVINDVSRGVRSGS